MTRPSLLVVNQYYKPDLASTGRYAAGLCSGLVERGWQVRVVCGQPSYSRGRVGGAAVHEVLDGVEVHRVSLSGVAGRDSIPRRFLGYGLFMQRAWRQAASLVKAQRPDVVLTFHNPPFVGLIGRRIVREFGVPFVYAPFDILPDVVKVAGWPLPDVAFRMWDGVNSAIYNAANIVLVLDDSMKRILVAKGVEAEKVDVISLWAIPDLSDQPGSDELRREVGVSDEDILVIYAGNMGYMHSLQEILGAASLVRESRVHFLVIGEGPGRSSFEQRLEAEQLSNVDFMGYQPEPRFRSLVASSDAALVTVRSGAEELGMPSRALTFLSAGTPVLALCRRLGPLADLVEGRGVGWIVGSAQQLADVLLSLDANPPMRSEAAALCRSTYGSLFSMARSVDALHLALERARS